MRVLGGCSLEYCMESYVRAIGAAAQQIAARLPLLGDEVRGLMRETLKFTFHVDKQSKVSLAW